MPRRKRTPIPKLYSLTQLTPIIKKLKKRRKKVVFTTGAYDLLHSGQTHYLLEGRGLGDVLVVGVESNRSRRREKGPGHPMIDERTRAELLSFLPFVDYLVIVVERELLPVLEKLQPDIFYTYVGDWKTRWRGRGEQNLVRGYGGKVVKVPGSKPYVSSSQLVRQVADLRIKEMVEYFFGKAKIDLASGDFSYRPGSALKTEVRKEVLELGHHPPKNLLGWQFVGYLVPREKLTDLGKRLRRQGQRVIFTAGSFDLLHVGHARYLKRAADLADVLVVGVSSNRAVRQLKGRGRPIVDELSRADILCHLEPVDYVVIFDETRVVSLLKDLKPDIFFIPKDDWNEGFRDSQEYRVVKSYGGMVARVPKQSPSLSASRLIRRAAGVRVQELFKEAIKEAKREQALLEKPWSAGKGRDEYEFYR